MFKRTVPFHLSVQRERGSVPLHCYREGGSVCGVEKVCSFMHSFLIPVYVRREFILSNSESFHLCACVFVYLLSEVMH